ncbi:MAG: PVC-type heme-binding CxxCH protein [Pirellulaceae bacterium]
MHTQFSTRLLPNCLALLGLLFASASLPAQAEEEGFKAIFDGKTLKGWRGDDKFWSVQDGAITGITTPENPTKGNTFIFWDQGEVDDFELKLQYKLVGGNSGIQYRSVDLGNFVAKGYQADFESGKTYSGINYEERGRGILAQRGQKATVTDGKGPYEAETFAKSEDLQAKINDEDWNEYHIIAKGNHLTHKINGQVMSEVIDNGEKDSRRSGVLALQLHAGPPMNVQFKDIQLKRLPLKDKKKVVFVPGNPSHGFGAHEHMGGSRLLQIALQENMPGFVTTLYEGGWPADPTAFDNADTVVVYGDGGGGHLLMPHLDKFDEVMQRGTGLVQLHYAVEIPAGKPGDLFLKWMGGYFEANWSVNPHWVAKFEKLPKHEITRGVKPFEINDEWYYHMRFRENMEDVTPILTAIPPESTLDRPDGPHSGNPHVRKTKGQPQHLAWAAEREDGGRGFGFTGGHHHWNWGDENFRKVVLNAIVWVSKVEVPEEGVTSDSLTRSDLEGIIGGAPPQRTSSAEKKKSADLKAATFTSPLVTTKTPGHRTEIEVEITGAKQLHLVVSDGDDGYSADWAAWIEPRLVGPEGEKKLTELKWKAVQSDWGETHIDRNAAGRGLRVAGEPVKYGIGTHANSVITYDLPPGYTHFKAHGGIDNGGSDQFKGEASSIRFHVFTQDPRQALNRNKEAVREPENAVAGLDVHEKLEATLSASEPEITSLTNIDIDHRGRIWACEVMNYRGNNGKRPEGDRILILEDTTGDGVMDSIEVFYQGRDIDSAMGICVLGNKVIVSATPNVIVFTDENGDDKPDRKELLFTKTGQPQHDHSVHSFLFGPDGKLYWNFGNTGKAVHDKHGEVVTDLAGNKIIDNGKPYFGGMPFRCNLDGSQMETLGHNFRNNYETTVDSFGTLWQSDNDDDGNRGVRINYVMQYGNYGYLDERTGAGWREPRTNWEPETPERHWHLNDPGVVPNLLQTFAGSPTGICLYEGDLLPVEFQNQMIHCDPGPNVVRAYPVKNDGAGYSAEIVEILKGVRDNWFRPADVCVAPDGSIFVSDWYDPGVGGHAQRDLDQGRLFRVAPKGAKYDVPKFDFDTIEGAIAALKNPNLSVRYMAWTALHNRQAEAEPALREVFNSADDPRYRARALWLLGKMKDRGEHYVSLALADGDPNIQITGLRLAHQLGLPPHKVVAKVVSDPSPQVRREAALTLRFDDSPEAAKLWAELAATHDGEDRWYLEALGIGAELKWDACLDAFLAKVGNNRNTPAVRDIIWRSRAEQTPQLLAEIIADPSVPADELPRYFRAFDFQENKANVTQVLADLAFSGAIRADAEGLILSESVGRLQGFDIGKNSRQREAMENLLQKLAGTPQFVQLVDRFNLENRYAELLKLATERPDDSVGVAAARVLVEKRQEEMLRKGLADADVQKATALTQALANSATGGANGLMFELLADSGKDIELRRIAVKALAANRGGAERLIALAKKGELEEDLKQAAAAPLSTGVWNDIRNEAATLFPPPPAKDNQPLPNLHALVGRRGDATKGKTVFDTTGTCAKCHIVGEVGKEVGPNLTEIGTKLSREALYESILFPSAGISHNYETFAVLLDSGTVVTGLKTSETDQEVKIKDAEGLERAFPKSEIDELRKLPVSLMPADLQRTMTVQELVDVVEYLGTLRK